MASGREGGKLHVLFLPYLTTSHIMNQTNAARLFAAQGVKVSIITTKNNATIIQSSIDQATELGHEIYVHTLKFPSFEMGLPEGLENTSAATAPEIILKVHMGVSRLKEPIQQLIRDLSPHCIISDLLYTWTPDLAEELKIPRILFCPSGFFSHCLRHNLEHYEPHKAVRSDSESFLVPGLPDSIQMKSSQLEDYVKDRASYEEIAKKIKDSELRCFGHVLDTFYELEPQYADYYKKIKGTKCWTLGPLFYSNSEKSSNITAAVKNTTCLKWLDSKEPSTVLYVAFGGSVIFSDAQLREIALALEASNQPFIWVVRGKKENEQEEGWLPDGFEERIRNENRGLMVRGWAPQVMILSHPAVGGFMTHCGWHSTIEALTAGVPLITWPLFCEQSYNEKFLELLNVGVSVGADHLNVTSLIEGTLVGNKQIEDAIKRLMTDAEESRGIRNRGKEIAGLAKKAVEKGGSSYENLLSLIRDLKSCAFRIKS